ncbi:MAG TPA: LLM class flavin-dependent oxidoreductase, partial [Streptosporangiaceae bacterium]
MTQPVKFGLNVDPNTGGLPIAERITAIADASGLDLVGVQDHPYNDGFTDTLALITWLAARTSHVHLFPNVANLPLRPPAMLAKQAATIDVLSAGRVPAPRTTSACGSASSARAIQLVGAKADGWSVSVPYVPPDRLPELNQIITSAARD